MVQVAAWFVAGVAWAFVALLGPVLWRLGKADPKRIAQLDVWSLLLSSGVAVAATAVALGVGQ